MNKDIKHSIEEISEELMQIIDSLEELSEDNPDLSISINKTIDKLTEACDLIDEL